MTDGDIDLRGTQGAVVLPGGTVVQHYGKTEQERPETKQHSMNPQTPGDFNSRMYDQGRELAEIKARLVALEVSVNQIMAMLQRPSVAVTLNQLLISIGLAIVIVLAVLGASYARF